MFSLPEGKPYETIINIETVSFFSFKIVICNTYVSLPEVNHISYIKQYQTIYQLIGLRDKLQETPMIFMGKSMVSG